MFISTYWPGGYWSWNFWPPLYWPILLRSGCPLEIEATGDVYGVLASVPLTVVTASAPTYRMTATAPLLGVTAVASGNLTVEVTACL